MKALFAISTPLIIVMYLSACTPSRYYAYDVELTHPVHNQKLEYSNDTLEIDFVLEPKWISFTLLNKSNDGIKISWDEVSFSINGQAYRAVHKATGVLSINMVQPPTTIPPRASLQDYLIPSSNIKGSGGSTTILSMFPTYDYGNKKTKATALALKGTRVTIFLPYYMAGKYVSAYYDIMINNVNQFKKDPKK